MAKSKRSGYVQYTSEQITQILQAGKSSNKSKAFNDLSKTLKIPANKLLQKFYRITEKKHTKKASKSVIQKPQPITDRAPKPKPSQGSANEIRIGLNSIKEILIDLSDTTAGEVVIELRQ